MNQYSHIRLWLYIVIGTLPAMVEWLTLTFDTSTRGILILVAKTVLSAAITARAYIDTGGRMGEPKVEDPEVVQTITTEVKESNL